MTRIIIIFMASWLVAFTPAHPLKMCVCQAQYQKASSQLQFKFRFFRDDLEATLSKQTGKELHLEQISPENSQVVSAFIFQHFWIKINGQDLPLTFVQSAIDDVVLVMEFKADGLAVKPNTQVDVHNSILLDVFPDQYNIVRFDFSGDGNMQTMRFERQERDLRLTVKA